VLISNDSKLIKNSGIANSDKIERKHPIFAFMLTKFFDFNKTHDLLNRETKFIVATSGGLDSMALVDLCYKAGFDFALAHCNFKLRGDESDRDADFVKKTAETLNLQHFEKEFDTKYFAEKNKLSIQESARLLRYEWFEQLLISEEFEFYATAHQFDDKIETFMINLFRGTGVSGLRSILPKNGNCIRPLLFAYRSEIHEYAWKNRIQYREDSSNEENHYTRNKIRHFIIPAIEKIYPEFRKGFENTFNALTSTEAFMRDEMSKTAGKLVKIENDKAFININQLKENSHIELYLFEILKNYDFNPSTINEICRSIEGISGKKFYSKTHFLIRERDDLVITNLEKKTGIHLDDTILIEKFHTHIDEPVRLTFEIEIISPDFEIQKDKNVALLEYDKLTYPLILRKPLPGDSFSPLGMVGTKKISDFLIDSKFTNEQKNNVLVLLSGDKIVWIIGQRIDEKYKITSETKKVMKIVFEKKRWNT